LFSTKQFHEQVPTIRIIDTNKPTHLDISNAEKALRKKVKEEGKEEIYDDTKIPGYVFKS